MKNIQYINAGAGSGKTTKLTQILSEELSKNDEPIRPSEVILTTFTELAASEFREKSRERLFHDGHPEIAAELDSATIGTVHSVALSFIQKYWYLIGISPDMKVMSDDDLQVYISESLGNYVSKDELDFFRTYCNYFGLKVGSSADLDFWKDDLLDIIDKVNNYDVDVEQSKVNSSHVVEQIFNSNTALNHDLYNRFVDLYVAEFPAFSDAQKVKLQTLFDGLKSKALTYSVIVKLYKELTREKPDMGKKKQEKFRMLMGDGNYNALITNLKAYQTSSVGNDSPGGMMKKLIVILFDIAKEWKDGFNQFKALRHIIDYNDMERLFLALLETPQVKEEIEGTYKLMMVDEFQDSSPIQLAIFKKLSDMMKQSYWVGDPKQSIYGFRGADVDLVSEITQEFYDENLDPELHLTHDKLPNSWRTREPLVNLTNACFTRAFDGIINKENVVLDAARHEDMRFSYPLSHWNCLASNAEIFVDKVADRIKLLLDTKPYVQIKNKNEFRSIEPGDIAILCRRNDECKAFAKALIRKGIPVSFVNVEILQQTEVQLVITLLKFMIDSTNKHVRADLLRLLEDIPTQDILQQRLDYLVGLVSEATNDVGDIVKDVKPDLWLEDDNPLIRKLMSFKQTVMNLSVSDLMDSVVYGLALPEIVSKWGDVDNRRQNLQTLCALAKKYDEHCLQMGIGSSVSGLLTYLSYAEIDSKIDNASKAVKVLTYHKSKGLEWHYVILSSLSDDSLEENKFTKKCFWGVHELRHPNPNEKFSYVIQYLPAIVDGKTNLPQPIIDNSKKQNTFTTLQEKERKELRHLLYVGVTRARDYLTTLSHQTSGNALPILYWIRNSGISQGSIDKNATELWMYEELTPAFEDIANCSAVEAFNATSYSHYVYPDNMEKSRESKFLSPSKLPEIEVAKENVKILKDLDCRIDPYKPKDIDEAAAGTCIHNIFAVYDPLLSHQENVDKATSIRDGNNMYEVIPDTDTVISSIENLYAWLEDTYGKPYAIMHEVPFIHPLPGQIVRGEIDLLWYTSENECVLIDFKNFPGNKAMITTPSEKNEHYAGKYAAQLKAYRDVLINSGITVRDTLIYYSVMGCVVQIKI